MPAAQKAGWFINRPNRVPHYQRLFQRHDGVRDWRKTPRSRLYLYPYYTILLTSFSAATYGMIRMMLGHKTFFGKG